MVNKTVQWYNDAYEEMLLQAKPEWYKAVSDLVEGLYLDVSCGLGLCLRFADGVGCDFSKKSVSLARRIAKDSCFVVCDAQHLAFRSNSFETVSCLGSLEHYPDYISALKEARRILKGNGLLLVSITNKNRWTSIFRFLFRGLRQPIEKPLTVSNSLKILQGTSFSITKITNPHQFDFLNYCNLPKFISRFLNYIDRIMPSSSAIEPLYICRKP